jgi:hypothetical protein
MDDRSNANDVCSAVVIRGAAADDTVKASGYFTVQCFGPDGVLKWEDQFKNTVVTQGKSLMLNATFTAGYSLVGPWMGLISSVGFSAIAVTDTMISHPGWNEAGTSFAPAYGGGLRTSSPFSPAIPTINSITTSPSPAFAITSSGTVKGAFITLGPGATAPQYATGGALYSAGLFTGGDRIVANLDVIIVTYTTTLT